MMRPNISKASLWLGVVDLPQHKRLDKSGEELKKVMNVKQVDLRMFSAEKFYQLADSVDLMVVSSTDEPGGLTGDDQEMIKAYVDTGSLFDEDEELV